MAYNVPTFAQIRDQYLQAVLNQNPDAAIGPDSDHYVRASAIAAVMEGFYSHQVWVLRQALPDTADADYMEKMANLRGLARKPAAAASGVVRFGGTAGTAVALGTQVANAQGVLFQTLAAAVIGVGGTVDVDAGAVVAGAAGNQSASTPATVQSPSSGLSAAATILSMTGGDDIETDDALLGRLLLDMSEVAQGGNDTDYKRWALSVNGVRRAFVFPLRRGVGTVDVVPMPASGLPSPTLLASVQAVLDANRPVGMREDSPVLALAPTAVPVAVTASLVLADGYTLGVVDDSVLAAVAAIFSSLEPGATLHRNQLIAAIMNVPGVTDVTLALPAANVTCSVNSTALELITQGAVTLS